MQTRASPNLQTLHNLAREANINSFESLSKSDLFQKLKEQFDFDRLQRQENRRLRVEESMLKKKRLYGDLDREADSSTSSVVEDVLVKRPRIRHPLNKVDPIMFTPIKKNRTFRIVRPNGGSVLFNVDTLVDYIAKTGDFTDPVTRIPLSDEDLQDLDSKAKKLKLEKPSLYELKKNPQAFADFKFRRDALLGLERCAGEVVTDILNIVESCEPDEAQMRLVLRELPAFADYYRQLKDADAPYASQCMAHWKLFLEGPPNKPNEDEYGLIEVVGGFFKACENGTVPASTIGLNF